jgi:hypothetical protein
MATRMRAGPEPILPARDVDRTRSFYESLGFTAGFNDDHYDILRRGDLVVRHHSRPRPTSRGGCGSSRCGIRQAT